MCSLKRRILRTLRSAAKAYREIRKVPPPENIGENSWKLTAVVSGPSMKLINAFIPADRMRF